MDSSIIDARAAKTKQMFEVTAHTAWNINKVLKDMPRTGKKRRNIFIKSYKRRPQNKKKRALVLARVAMTTFFGSMQMLTVMQTPIPKYKKGTV